MFPREGLLQEGESRQLIVTARLSDGTREDLTHRVRFESRQQEVAELAGQGLVRALNPGESNILVRGAGYEVQSRIGVVAEWIPDYPEMSRTNFIDDEVFAKLRKFNILPSPRSGDAEFLRRVCLDLTGRIPPAGRVREFLADPDPQKREKLIEGAARLPRVHRLLDLPIGRSVPGGRLSGGDQSQVEPVLLGVDSGRRGPQPSLRPGG